MNEGCQTQKESELDRGLKNVEQAVEQLFNNTEKLAAKLTPVMRPGTTEDPTASEKVEQTVFSPTGIWLQSIQTLLFKTIDLIDTINGQIEV